MIAIGGKDIGTVDLTPQAVVRRSVADFTYHWGVTFERAEDDLGEYDVAYFTLCDRVVALMRHEGEPADTVSLYLPDDLDEQKLGQSVEAIMKALDITPELLVWQGTNRPVAA